MKRIVFILGNLAILLLFSSCSFHPHYVCEYISEKKLYSKALKGNIFDSSFEEYTDGENVFLLKLEATPCYVKSKRESQCRFLLTVYSKSEEYNYHIDSINLFIDGMEHDINEYEIIYYPYESEKYTSFTKCSYIKDYYCSNYHLGFFNFPTPKDNVVIFKVIISDDKMNKYTFIYNYSLKFTYELFFSKV